MHKVSAMDSPLPPTPARCLLCIELLSLTDVTLLQQLLVQRPLAKLVTKNVVH